MSEPTPYYDDDQNVEQYIQMAEGYDGRLLVTVLRQQLSPGASVLEIGMGPGKDLLLLGEHYRVTGSDQSRVFLDRFRAQHPEADLLHLDAATLATERQFDAIYSNKVLYHLTRDALIASFERQKSVLKPGGIALHAFWHGEGEDKMHGLHFAYYTEATLRALVEAHFEVIAMQRYTEMETDDSLYVVFKNRS